MKNASGAEAQTFKSSPASLSVSAGSNWDVCSENSLAIDGRGAIPYETLAASGIGDFRYILKWNELNSPMKRNVTIDQVGGAGLYLLSDLGAGVSGEIHHVDSGYNVVGMVAVDAAHDVAELLSSLKTAD